MVKKFEHTKIQQKAIDRALARLFERRRERERKAAAKSAETKRRRIAEKRQAKAAAAKPKQPNNAMRQKLALPVKRMMLARMEPGTWYRFGEIRAIMPEYPKGSISTALWHLREQGAIERAGNPDYDLSDPVKAMATGRYLYSLSTIGQEQGQDARNALAGSKKPAEAESRSAGSIQRTPTTQRRGMRQD